MNHWGLEAWDMDMDATPRGSAWELGMISTPKGGGRAVRQELGWLGARRGLV